MAKGSTYMRGLCIVLNVLLAKSFLSTFCLQIFGVILLLFGIVANSIKGAPLEASKIPLFGWTYGVFLSVGFGLATILLSILGLYGAYKVQVLPLLLYSVFMAIKLIVLTVLAIIATLKQPQVESEIQLSFGRMTTDLSTDPVLWRELNKLQHRAQCCGLNNYTDWNDHIPHSCLCPPNYPDCVRVSKTKVQNIEGIRNSNSETASPEEMDFYVYRMICGPILMEFVRNCFRILLGIIFTLATIEVAAVIVALLLWYKIHTQSQGTDFSQDTSRTKYELQPDKMP
ncbi:hypothetical protein NFI96_015803 [Prochilodus magdalenae]|nr:hypothetical protein NFI96_015803 [Prochilodus magdalenae]